MLVDYNLLNETSKFYVFPSSRKMYPEEFTAINQKVKQFLQNLIAVNSFFEIKYQRFIIIFISEETPLSIDQNESLILLLNTFENEFKISLIDKVKVFFKQGAYVQVKEIPDFKKLIKNKSVSKKTLIFNNFINTKSEYDCCWEVPADESWVSHLF
ncbi:MAG: ABC transporter ATPase [Bacteroidota bacterium]